MKHLNSESPAEPGAAGWSLQTPAHPPPRHRTWLAAWVQHLLHYFGSLLPPFQAWMRCEQTLPELQNGHRATCSLLLAAAAASIASKSTSAGVSCRAWLGRTAPSTAQPVPAASQHLLLHPGTVCADVAVWALPPLRNTEEPKRLLHP